MSFTSSANHDKASKAISKTSRTKQNQAEPSRTKQITTQPAELTRANQN
ncbi:hypothetical protein J4233_04675 [Candidatus Pacearchaeota archaeon]|nr:hypothetical protein [Candidatus Pacearchaeota archaeon]